MKVSVIIPAYNQQDLIQKAIDSIPKRDDIEIIVIDDCSTDNTMNILMKNREVNKNFTLLHNKENKGVGYTVNKGYDNAKGEYVVLLGSDDYFYPEEFIKCMELLDGTDIVYFDLKINDGSIFKLCDATKFGYCGSVKFIRREFLGNLRKDELRAGEDYYFYRKLMDKNPTEKFSNLVVKHYNFPRKNSLSWQVKEGLL